MIENNNLLISNFLFSNKSVHECTLLFEKRKSQFTNVIAFLMTSFFDIPNKTLIGRWILNFEVQFTKCDLMVAIMIRGLQALLLTSVFHEGLSFMVIGQNSTCSSCLALAAGGSRGCYKSRRKSPFGYFSDPKFSNSLSMHHSVT